MKLLGLFLIPCVFTKKILWGQKFLKTGTGKNRGFPEHCVLVQFVLQGDEMPEPKSMLEATSEANNLASLSEAKETYTRGMEEVCGAERPYINEHVLEIEHLRIHDDALEVFNSRRKMGGEEFSTKYREKLESEIQESFENLKVRLFISSQH